MRRATQLHSIQMSMTASEMATKKNREFWKGVKKRDRTERMRDLANKRWKKAAISEPQNSAGVPAKRVSRAKVSTEGR